jgi:predicted RNA binding protein YcfA (HicA-like mRNA interferase family)
VVKKIRDRGLTRFLVDLFNFVVHIWKNEWGEKVRVIIQAATRGSHRQYKHPVKKGRVTIAGHPGDELAPGTLNSVLKQAGLKKE